MEEQTMKHILMVTLILAALINGACVPMPPKPTTPPPNIPNPASKYCADQGGKLEIRTEAAGQVGYCLFPNGSECEEWAFMRGECKPATP
jgi:putative hemolysin